jgi:hypothetical protein
MNDRGLDRAATSARPTSDLPASEQQSTASPVAVPGLAYVDFARALKDALRDLHRPDLLARNPLLSCGIGNLCAGP